ncbi:MEDS domain-containing protein [Micromonospora mirobrigensis]|uniref:MEDS: MEthanogen/methylotroph, DcmR Sensory domain n=1 Tax=Micromonospora mirobrigensis TaxID=262898 RepID=A0A1C4W4I2_9ACTN|nr:MEDS domain-containing protein [Micromonospora mirobrigensis]SCE91146.1 MEDS: MEthanogen/methylotroph, DcmR Sensory domain [Micromonospora mirobrigensis]
MTASSVVDQLQLGDHICWAYDDEADGLDAAVTFVATGLRLGQKVICYTDTVTPAGMRQRLETAGVPTESALATGALRVVPATESYLPDGPFLGDAMIAGLADEIDRAERENHPGLRLVGDMAWVRRTGVGVAELSRYEAGLNQLFLDGRAVGMCLYDRRLFPPAQMRAVVAAHPGSAGPHVGRTWRPMLRAYRTVEPAGLRLVGQVDRSNRNAFQAVLAELTGERPGARPAVLDVSELSFADVDGAHTLAGVLRGRPTEVRLVGCRPTLVRLLDLVAATEAGNLAERPA